MVHEIENFYGVYLLYCLNPRYKGWTYIGFTVNPNRRIQQHNGGVLAGGAKRTNGKGPWDMVLIVHGFPNMISALRFEWAWTKPKVSRRLRQIPNKRAKETKFLYCIRVMCSMLRTGPWDRLPLTVRWLKQEYKVDFDPQLLPPAHMPLEYGPVRSTKVKAKKSQETDDGDNATFLPLTCTVCHLSIKSKSEMITCIACHSTSHVICLARHFLSQNQQQPDQLMPIDGACPLCAAVLLWGDLVRYKMGCYQQEAAIGDMQSDDDNSQSWEDELQSS